MLYPLRAAKMSAKTDGVFVTTEDVLIRNLAEKEGVGIIERPIELSQPTNQHKDVIQHAVEAVQELHPG